MDEIIIFSRGLDGSAIFKVRIKGKITVLAEGNLKEISRYLCENYPEVAKQLPLYQEGGVSLSAEFSKLQPSQIFDMGTRIKFEFSK